MCDCIQVINFPAVVVRPVLDDVCRDELVTVLDRRRDERGEVAAGVGFGHTDAPGVVSRQHPGQERLLLHPVEVRLKAQPWVTDIALSELAPRVSDILYALRKAGKGALRFLIPLVAAQAAQAEADTTAAQLSQLMVPPNFRQLQLDSLLSDYLHQEAL